MRSDLFPPLQLGSLSNRLTYFRCFLIGRTEIRRFIRRRKAYSQIEPIKFGDIYRMLLSHSLQGQDN